MSTVFSENLNVIPEAPSAIVPQSENAQMRTQDNPLQDYVLRVMRDNNLSYPEVERMERRRGAEIGKSTIQQIAKGQTTNPGIHTLVELAWGLGRPVEEVINTALGVPVMETNHFRKSEFANLSDLYQQLPLGEQRTMRRYLQMLDREMRRVLMLLSDSDSVE